MTFYSTNVRILFMKRLQYSLLMLLGALIWGLAFAFQSQAMMLGMLPYAYTAVRMGLGGLCLLPVVLINRKKTLPATKKERKKLMAVGALLGLMLAIATNLQQLGIQYTTAAKSAFTTALYIVFVPIGGLFLGKKTRPALWLCLLLALCGLYFLSLKPGDLTFSKGDLLTFACALAFTVQILMIDRLAADYHPLTLCCVQFLFVALYTLLPMGLFEGFSLQGLLPSWYCILYAGVLSGSVAYTIQIIGQKHLPAALASLLMSFESVFGALGGALLLHQTLSGRELLGCGLMFTAVVLSQLLGTPRGGSPS